MPSANTFRPGPSRARPPAVIASFLGAVVLPAVVLVGPGRAAADGLVEDGPAAAAADDDAAASPEPRPEPSPFHRLNPLDAPEWAVGAAFDAAPLADGSYDQILENLGYEENGSGKGVAFYGGARLLGPLWLGGRLGMRNRNFQQPNDIANILGVDLLAWADLRFPVGEWIELGARAGVGGSLVWLRLNGETERGATPRLNLAGLVGLPLPGPVRLVVRVGWDFWRWTDAGGSGADVDLGGLVVGGAVEIRPWDRVERR